MGLLKQECAGYFSKRYMVSDNRQNFGSKNLDRGYAALVSNLFLKIPVFTSDYAIVIFFGDDIIALNLPVNRHLVQNFEDALKEKYPTRIIGELKWFLGR